MISVQLEIGGAFELRFQDLPHRVLDQQGGREAGRLGWEFSGLGHSELRWWDLGEEFRTSSLWRGGIPDIQVGLRAEMAESKSLCQGWRDMQMGME